MPREHPQTTVSLPLHAVSLRLFPCRQTDAPHEIGIAKARALEEGKPEAMLEKIAQGRLEKFKDEVVLLRQAYIRDDKTTVEKLLLEQVASLGENIVIRRFARWELGEVSE